MPGSAPQRDSNLPSGNGTPQVLARTTSSGPCQRDFTIFLVRSEGLEPPRCYSLPPQGSASTNSATSACQDRYGTPDRNNRAGCNNSEMCGQGLREHPSSPLS